MTITMNEPTKKNIFDIYESKLPFLKLPKGRYFILVRIAFILCASFLVALGIFELLTIGIIFYKLL